MRMTKDEILLVMIVLLSLVVGAVAELYRHRHPRGEATLERTAPPSGGRQIAGDKVAK